MGGQSLRRPRGTLKDAAPPWESVAATHESALADARRALGEELYAAHLAEGRLLSAADAVARYQPASAASDLLAG